MNFLKRLLGGRPMKYEGISFIDKVSGKKVNYYVDTLGRKWMAESSWALFRVEREMINEYITTIMPIEVRALDLAFGGDMQKLLPAYSSIPEEFKNFNSKNNKWLQVTSDWFFYGLKNTTWTPKQGIDQDKALRHIAAILGSWKPKHEHKEAGAAYLLSLWFDDVTYERAK